MSQPINISVTMDADAFRDFSSFDLFRHRRAWQRPLTFTVILLVFAGVCLSQIGKLEGAALLTVVLSVVALGFPAVYFYTYFHNLTLQVKKMGLKDPKPFYRLQLDDDGLAVWMAGEQDKADPPRRCDWHHIHLAYRTQNAIYIYVQQTQAYLWNSSLDAAWALLQEKLPADRLRDFR
mgnify:CR=1 FL=1